MGEDRPQPLPATRPVPKASGCGVVMTLVVVLAFLLVVMMLLGARLGRPPVVPPLAESLAPATAI